MCVVTEEFAPRPAFLAASPEARAAFFDSLSSGATALADQGVTTLGRGRADPSGERSSSHQWFAVWQLPARVPAEEFLAAVRASGCYGHVEQTDLRSELRPVSDVVAEHLVLR